VSTETRAGCSALTVRGYPAVRHVPDQAGERITHSPVCRACLVRQRDVATGNSNPCARTRFGTKSRHISL